MGDNQQASELLIEGAKSYPQALAALRDFRDTVCASVRAVVRDDLTLIAKSLGVNLDASEIVNRARPYELAAADGENASVGVVIRRDNKEGWNLYYTLRWYVEEEDAPFYFAASIWFKQSAVGDSAFRAFQKLAMKLPVKYADSEIYMKRKLESDDMARFPSVVREVVHEWAKAWSQAGGLKTFLAQK